MADRDARELFEAQFAQGKHLCVGLDPDMSKIPQGVSLEKFLLDIVIETAPYAAAYKPNIAFYEGEFQVGPSRTLHLPGLQALYKVTSFILDRFPEIPVILDTKRGDIGKSNIGYVKANFKVYGADATTVHGYMGEESLAPILDEPGKLIFVLCRTSNEGAGEFQDLVVAEDGDSPAERLYQRVARNVAHKWIHKNTGLVMGATSPKEIREVRKITGPGMLLLIPGVGTQGGDLVKSVLYASKGGGLFLIVAASSVIHASTGMDWAKAAGAEAKRLDSEIRRRSWQKGNRR